jgi:hypothetical protein
LGQGSACLAKKLALLPRPLQQQLRRSWHKKKRAVKLWARDISETWLRIDMQWSFERLSSCNPAVHCLYLVFTVVLCALLFAEPMVVGEPLGRNLYPEYKQVPSAARAARL